MRIQLGCVHLSQFADRATWCREKFATLPRAELRHGSLVCAAWVSDGRTCDPLPRILCILQKHEVQGLAGFSEVGLFMDWLCFSHGTEVTGVRILLTGQLRSVGLAFKGTVRSACFLTPPSISLHSDTGYLVRPHSLRA